VSEDEHTGLASDAPVVSHADPMGVSMDVVRRLALVNARINAGSDLGETLQAVADGIVDVLGFGAAVMNHQTATGDFEVVAVAGPDEIRAALSGVVHPRQTILEALELADQWGALRFIPHDRTDNIEVFWVPDLPYDDDPQAWHPMDALLVPLFTAVGDMVGIISVDLPPENRRPSRLLCELLEVFAMQAGLAIAGVELRARYDEERRARERVLSDLASKDALTGLPNRRALTEALAASVRQAKRTGRCGALLFCDVDGMKRLNDRQGHARGDLALNAWGEELAARVRDEDFVARIGGDEFVVVAPGLPPEGAEVMARRLREPAGDVLNLAGLTLSVGIAPIDGTLQPDEILDLADRAMYIDKADRRRQSKPA
jgi:diguanylate cyclase (GGDEF)-like protein